MRLRKVFDVENKCFIEVNAVFAAIPGSSWFNS